MSSSSNLPLHWLAEKEKRNPEREPRRSKWIIHKSRLLIDFKAVQFFHSKPFLQPRERKGYPNSAHKSGRLGREDDQSVCSTEYTTHPVWFKIMAANGVGLSSCAKQCLCTPSITGRRQQYSLPSPSVVEALDQLCLPQADALFSRAAHPAEGWHFE